VTDTVTLDGKGSSDVDGDALTYSWSFVSRPSGSSAVLSNPAAINPAFVVDVPGTYVAQLIVNDGTVNSAPDTVVIGTENTAPVADAGPDRTAHVTDTVTLDGKGSSDVDGDALTYSWSFVSRPSGSSAVLSNPAAVNPAFVADAPGTYVAQLIVNDGTAGSAPDTVVIITENTAPVADAGPDRTAHVTDTVTLDGKGSSDVDGDALTYSWSFVSRPSGSSAVLSNPAAVNPAFVMDVAGIYSVQLIVSDGIESSFPDTVRIETAPPDIITLSPSLVSMLTRSTRTMNISLNSPAGTGGLDIDLSAGNALVTLPARVTVPQGQSSAAFTIASAVDTGSITVSASAAGLTGDDSSVTVQPRTFTLSSPLVGIDRTVRGTIALAQPAPSGGATIALSVANTGVAAVSPATVTILEGYTTGNFELTGGLSAGSTTITADGMDDGYSTQTLDITVTDWLLDLPPARELALGQTDSIWVFIAPHPAPAGGFEISIQSSDSSLVDVLTPAVTIPEGAWSATGIIRASTGSTGTVMITASNPNFAPDTMQVTVTASLNILESFSSFGDMSTDTIAVQLESGGHPFPAPPGGLTITLTSADPGCVAVAPSITIPEGATFGTAALTYGDSTSLPCTTTVTAGSSLFGSDTVEVTVGQTPDLGNIIASSSSGRVGSGLQQQYRMNLSTANHGGVTVQMKSSDPSVALLAPDATTAGLPVTEIFVPDGQNYYYFYIQGVCLATGIATITAKSVRFNQGSMSIDIVQPVLVITGLAASTSTLSADDPFYVRCGILNTSGTGISGYQNASAGTDGVTVTLTSSNAAVGQLITSAGNGGSVTVVIPANDNNSPTSVTAGGAAFDPAGSGTVTVSAASPGFDNTWSGSSAAVTVSQPGITFSGANYYRVGAGLQVQGAISLGGSDHGGVNVRISSSDDTKARIAPYAATAGSSFVDLFIPNGQSTGYFYLQGVSQTTGSVGLTATSELFSGGAATADIVQPVLVITNLAASTSTLSADDPFYVRCGILNTAGTAIETWQYASAGTGGVTVTLTSSDPSVGQLITSAGSGDTVTVVIPVNDDHSPTSVTAGGAALDPVGGGTVTVSATAPGFDSTWSGSSATAAVSQPGIAFSASNYRVGAGLQTQGYVSLGGSDHGGVTVRVTSSNPTVARLASGATTAGTSFIDLSIPDGQSTGYFYLQGVSQTTGSVSLTATSPLFSDGAATADILQPVLRIEGLAASTSALSADDPFYVRCGILNTAGTGVGDYQNASAGTGGVPVTLAISNAAVGHLVTSAGNGGSVTVIIPVNDDHSPTSVTAGGAAFDPVGIGTVTVSATAPGFDNTWSGSYQTVAVSQPGITFSSSNNRVGAGLQTQRSITLGGSDHGGVTVRITSSDPTIARLASGATTAGTSFIDLSIPDGQSTGYFYLQGVSQATGSVSLTATSPLFSDGAATADILQPVLVITNLAPSTTTLSADDPFYVRCCILNTAGTGIDSYQNVSAEGDLTVTLTSSDPSVGQLVTSAGSADSVTMIIPVNSFRTPTSVSSGGVAFDPVAAGETTVSALASGFDSLWSGASLTVVVSP
ncbi:MAG: PKD domain-containing protein, partial [bacterium]